MYARPQNECFRFGSFTKVLGSLGFVWLTAPVAPSDVFELTASEEDDDLWFFETVTPIAMPAATRATRVTMEPMTYRDVSTRKQRLQRATDDPL